VIARLEGVLFERTPTRVVLDVHGVGYEVFVPLSTYERLPDEGKTVALRIHTHAREGALYLVRQLHTLRRAENTQQVREERFRALVERQHGALLRELLGAGGAHVLADVGDQDDLSGEPHTAPVSYGEGGVGGNRPGRRPGWRRAGSRPATNHRRPPCSPQ